MRLYQIKNLPNLTSLAKIIKAMQLSNQQQQKLFSSLLTSYNHLSQNKFSVQQVSNFCLILSFPFGCFQTHLLDYLLTVPNMNVKQYLSKFKMFLTYLNHRAIDSAHGFMVISKLEQEWKGLNGLRNQYLRLIKYNSFLTVKGFFDMLKTFPIFTNVFAANGNIMKLLFVRQISTKMSKQITWSGKSVDMTSVQDITCDFMAEDDPRMGNRKKLRMIFQQFVESHEKVEKQIKEATQYLNQSLCLNINLVEVDEEFQFPFEKQMQLWNSLSGEPIVLHRVRLIYSNLYKAILQQFQYRQPEQLGGEQVPLQNDLEFKASVLFSSMFIYLKIFSNSHLNVKKIKVMEFNISAYQVWKAIPYVLGSKSLAIPPSVRTSFFEFERDLILLHITIQEYLNLKQQTYQFPNYQLINTFIQRVKDHLAIRYLQYDLYFKIKQSDYCHTVIETIDKNAEEIMQANFDHVLVLSIYFITSYKRLIPSWSMYQIAQMYESFKNKVYEIKSVEDKSIIEIYNETFVRVAHRALRAVEKAQVPKEDFLTLMKQNNLINEKLANR